MDWTDYDSADSIAGVLATPGGILTRMRSVDADVRALGEDIEAQRDELAPTFVRGWRHWRDGWRSFYREHESLLPRMAPQTMLEVDSWARRLPSWRAQAEREGATLHSPRAPRPSPPPRLPDLPDLLPSLPDLSALARPMLGPFFDPRGPFSADYWDSLKTVAIAGGVIVGGLTLGLIALNLRAAAAQADGAKELLPLLLSARTGGAVR